MGCACIFYICSLALCAFSRELLLIGPTQEFIFVPIPQCLGNQYSFIISFSVHRTGKFRVLSVCTQIFISHTRPSILLGIVCVFPVSIVYRPYAELKYAQCARSQ